MSDFSAMISAAMQENQKALQAALDKNKADFDTMVDTTVAQAMEEIHKERDELLDGLAAKYPSLAGKLSEVKRG